MFENLLLTTIIDKYTQNEVTKIEKKMENEVIITKMDNYIPKKPIKTETLSENTQYTMTMERLKKNEFVKMEKSNEKSMRTTKTENYKQK
jgi:hypothetical protein